LKPNKKLLKKKFVQFLCFYISLFTKTNKLCITLFYNDEQFIIVNLWDFLMIFVEIRDYRQVIFIVGVSLNYSTLYFLCFSLCCMLFVSFITFIQYYVYELFLNITFKNWIKFIHYYLILFNDVGLKFCVNFSDIINTNILCTF